MNKNELRKMVDEGYVAEKKHSSLDLYLYDYTPKCVFEKVWNDTTMQCRGIVLDGDGNVVARPFKKFFNYEELDGLGIKLPDEKEFDAYEKMDGSLGICYYYNNTWYVNTRGSFDSDQAVFATKWFHENINQDFLLPDCTFLFEIIYPENRVVVDYGDFRGLVLLGVIWNETGYEVKAEGALQGMAEGMGVAVATKYSFKSFEEMFNARNGLSKNEEGFVITYRSGFKFKLKGEEYSRLHRAMFNLTPLDFWEAFDPKQMKISQDFLEQFPEEYDERVEELVEKVSLPFHQILGEIINIRMAMPMFGTDSQGLKERYLWLKENHPKRVDIVTCFMNEKYDKVSIMMKQESRPTRNEFVDLNDNT